MKKVLICSLMLLLLGGMFFDVSQAEAIGISPVKYDNIVLDPGTSTIQTLRVYNDTMHKDTYYFYSKNFEARGEEGQQVFSDLSESGVDLASWIFPEKESIVIEPWKEETINFIINVPENAEPGGHYAALFVSKRPPTEQDGSAVGLESEVGLLLLVTVTGDIIEGASLEEFGIVADKTKSNRLPVTFFTRIKNEGTNHFRPSGEIKIKNIFGQETTTIPANPAGGNVLPSSIRRLESVWLTDEKAIEVGGFVTELKNEWKNFAIGKYTAELTMNYSADREALTASTTFWVFPWRVCLVVFLLLVLFVLFIKLYNKIVVTMAKKRE